MFDCVLNFVSNLFKKSTWSFYRERIIFNMIWFKILSYFNIFKPKTIKHETKLGVIRGIVEPHENGQTYYSFQGIPFGKPPIGELRFMAPEPAEKWEGILDATKESKQSLQRHLITHKQSGSEDCLYLNIYTNSLPNEKKNLKPVMVFIHGGGFISGSNAKSIYGPDYIIENDVILVVIQYRLGLLGFLNLTDSKLGITGNNGFKDMILALKWVQDNIGDYGGDRNNVTIFGESAGAVSVHLLVMSPLSKGLFHKAIAQSGSSLNGWSHCMLNTAKELAKMTGCCSDDEKTILVHLQSLSENEIYAAQLKFDKVDRFTANERYVGWVVEPPSENVFFTKTPIEIISSGDYHHVPFVMGFTSSEGMLFEGVVAKHNKTKYWDSPEINVPCLLGIEEDTPEAKKLGESILKFYLGERPYCNKKHFPLLYNLLSDNCFLWGIYQAARNHAKTSTEPIYLYKLSVESHLNFYKHVNNIRTPGASHADDLGYLFKMCFTLKIHPNSLEDISRRRVCKLWTNFAKFGNPTPKDDKFLEVEWLPISEGVVNYLDIGESLELEQNPEDRRMKFWNDIYSLHPNTLKLL